MKPGFALTLTEDGIGLLHRARGGWQRLGGVSLDDPGLGETLKLMRSTAEGLAHGRLLTKLVIPDSQVLYTTLPVTGESQAEKRASLRRGLDGLTPYAVDDLVFDWQEPGDGTARLAVVARETLAEAEAFAVQHAFNPVCWVAAPPADKFEGEAFFGATSLAPNVLGRDERPEPDGPPVRPGAMADYAAGDDTPEAARPAPKPAAARKPRPAAPVEKPKAAATRPETPVETPVASAARTEAPAARPQARVGTLEAPAAKPEAPVGRPEAPAEKTETRPAPPTARAPGATAAAGAEAPDATDAPPDPAGTPTAEPPAESTTEPTTEPTSESTTEPAPPFASRRRGEGDVPAPAPPPPGPAAAPASRLTLAAPGAEAASSPGTTADPQAEAPTDPAPMPPRPPVPQGAPTTGAAGRPGAQRPPAVPGVTRPKVTAQPRPELPPARKATLLQDTAPARSGHGLRLGLALTGVLLLAMAAVSVWTLLPDGDDIAAVPPTADEPAPPETGADMAAMPDEPVTAPPALRTPDMPSVAQDSPAQAAAPPDPDAPEMDQQASNAPTLSESDAAEIYASTGLWQRAPEPPTAPSQDRIEDLYVAALDPSIRPPQAVFLPDPATTRAADQPLPMQPDPPGPDQTFVVDERGLVEATPEGALTPEGVMVFAGEPPILPRGRPLDAAIAPEAPETAAGEIAAAPEPETAPAAAPEAETPPAAEAPAPAGTAATDPAPDGVVIREGRPEIVPPPRPEIVVPVTQGPPPVTPPQRPNPAGTAAPEAAPESAAPEAETDAQAGTGAPLPGAQPTDSAAAPDPAPAPGTAPAAETAPDPDLPETAAMAANAATATRLAPFRPRLRPAELVPVAVTPEAAPSPGLRPRGRPDETLQATAPATEAALGADIEAALAAALATEEAEDALSEQAIGRSLRPAARPSDLGDRVAAAAPAVPPSAATAAPRLPTSANVARQATVENAINLRTVNLIGVYGASGERRALVRLPSGRYEKVKVGDRIDGGRVAAIGESQLRYVKNGRNLVLDLPGG